MKNKIITALIKRKGEVIDDDLARLIQVSENDEHFQRELMSLEIARIVSIAQITKTRKRVKLMNQDRLNQALFKE